jgi:hypothetical protein
VWECDIRRQQNSVFKVQVTVTVWFSGGGTGFVGTALGQLLRNKGYGVTIVSRMPGPQRMSWVMLLIKSFLGQSVLMKLLRPELMNQSYHKCNTVVSLRNKSPLLCV